MFIILCHFFILKREMTHDQATFYIEVTMQALRDGKGLAGKDGFSVAESALDRLIIAAFN